jgi:hypothetical protein
LAAVAVLDDGCELGDGAQRALEACQLQGLSVVDFVRESSGAALDRRLVGLIRQRQPTVVIVSEAPATARSVAEGSALDLATTVAGAISLAADANHDREWVNQAALPPWHVPYGLLARRRDAALRWGSSEYLPTIGQNVADQTLIGGALLARTVVASSGSELFTLSDRTPFSNSDVWSSLKHGAHAPPQRSSRPQRGHVGQVKTIINKRDTLDQLASQFDSSSASRAVWRQRIGRLVADLSPRIAGDWLWQLAEDYDPSARIELAAMAREALLENCAGHPLAWESRLWLANYYASEEAAWLEYRRQQQYTTSPQMRRDDSVQRVGLRAVPKTEMIDGIPHLVWTPELPEAAGDASDPRADIAGQSMPTGPGDFATYYGQRLQRSLALFRSVRQFDPELSEDPLVAYAESVVKRKQEGLVAAESDLRKIRLQRLPAIHRAMFTRELRLCGTRTWSQMGDLADCPAAASKPYLDAVLDDEFWRSQIQEGQLIVLTPQLEAKAGDAAQSPRAIDDPSLGRTQLMLAHDDQFLYIAAICHGGSAAGPPQEAAAANRRRDETLDSLDQIQLGIDIDRDGRHYYLFSVDARGNFADQVAENREWNPTWYLAHRRSGESWTVEGAIPLDQLAPPTTAADETIWGLAVRRLRPDGLVERWSPSVPDGVAAGAPDRLESREFLPSDGVFLFR